MANAQVVITNANEDTPALGGIFEGISFFLVQRLPQRSIFVQKIQSNGGRIVKLEAQADHVIADHLRKDCPAGSISFTFIDDAIKNGELPDPKDHKAGPAPGTIRETGSAIPGKSTRTPFTAEDDRVLWQWVQRLKTEGYLVKGNEIYKHLEAKNKRHTYQAWRDRYIKKLMDKPPAGVEVTVAANAPPSPPTAQDEQREISAEPAAAAWDNVSTEAVRGSEPGYNEENEHREGNESAVEPERCKDDGMEPDAEPDFTEDDFNDLLSEARNIENVSEHLEEKAWQAWSEEKPYHSAQSWCTYYQEQVRPVYLQRRAEKNKGREARHRARSESTTVDKVNENHAVEGEALDKDEQQRIVPIASPSRPGLSNSQKRKRHTEGPPPLESNGQKRLRRERREEPDISDQDESDENQFTETHEPEPRALGALSTQPIELLSSDDEEKQEDPHETLQTSELNRAAQMQLDVEQQAERGAAFLTSETNRQAQAQLHNEDPSRSDPEAALNGVFLSNLPTSEVNLLSDQQILEESFERQHESVGEEGSPPRELLLMSSQVNHAVPGQVDEGNPGGLIEPNGNLLTEANLASQQAQHKAELLRGTDLPEDDEAQDNEMQDEYAKYLQDTMNTSVQARSDPIDAHVQESSPRGGHRSIEVELPSQGMSLGIDDFELSPIRDLPMSSQQEIDDAFEEAINWPESPKLSQRMSIQPQSLQFETQITHPNLPSQQLELSQREDEHMASSLPTVLPQVSYPSLPERPQEAPVVQPTGSEDGSLDNERTRRSESPVFGRESSYVVIDDDQEVVPSPQDAVEDEIDLSIPEPEGGWGNLSSPNKADPSLDDALPNQRSILEEEWEVDGAERRRFENKRMQRVKSNQELQELAKFQAPSRRVEFDDAEDSEEDVEIVHIEQDIVDVSSDSSSSNSSESSEKVDGPDRGAHQKTALETQDILNAETQQPDLQMPLPPDSDEELGVHPSESDESVVDEAPAKPLEQSLSSAERSPASKWTRYEDKLLLRGFRKGMSATQVVKAYGIDRTSSAVRNRRQLLQKQFPGGEVPRTSETYESEESGDEELPSDPLEQPSSPSEQPSSPLNLATSESQRILPHIQKLPDEDIDSYVDKMVVFGFKEGSIINSLKCTSMRPDLADLVLLEEKSGKGLPADVAGIWSEEEDRTLESGNARGLRKLEEKHTWRELEERMQFLQDWREEE